MNLQQGYEDFFRDAARTPARAPATFGEIWSADWRAAGLDTVTGNRLFQDSYNELVGKIREQTNRDLPALARDLGVDFRLNAGAVSDIERVIDRLPADQRDALAPYRDPLTRARKRAGEIEREAAETSARIYGLSGLGVGFVAGVARQMVDPVNLAAAPLGASRVGVGVAGWLAREAAIGAGTQVIQEPAIQSARGLVGLESGFGEAFGNIVEAGVGQATLSGLLRGGARVLDEVRARRLGLDVETYRAGPDALLRPDASQPRQSPFEDPGKVATVDRVETPGAAPPREWVDAHAAASERRHADRFDVDARDLDAVRLLTARSDLFDDLAGGASPEARQAHAEAIDNAAAALEEGRALETPAMPEIAPRAIDDAADEAGPVIEIKEKDPRRWGGGRENSLAEFIARMGGMELTPDAIHAGFDKATVPFAGKLAREGGVPMDRLFERLHEAGYLRAPGDAYELRKTFDEILPLLQEELSGRRKHYPDTDSGRAALARDMRKSDDRHHAFDIDHAKELRAYDKAIRKAVKAQETDGELDLAIVNRAARAMLDAEHNGETLAAPEAFERAALEHWIERERLDAAEQFGLTDADIADVLGEPRRGDVTARAIEREDDIPPFWERPDEVQRGAALQDGGALEPQGAGRADAEGERGLRQRGEDLSAAGKDGGGEGSGRSADEPGSEAGADDLPQLVKPPDLSAVRSLPLEDASPELRAEVEAILDRLAPQRDKRVPLFANRLRTDAAGAAAHGVDPSQLGEGGTHFVAGLTDGFGLSTTIQIARALPNASEMFPWVARHESIHALRRIGLFTEKEWQHLYDASKKYGWADNAGKQSVEEGISEAFAAWGARRAAGDAPLKVDKEIDRIFQKIVDFYQRLREALTGKYREEWERIFSRIESGEIGARDITGTYKAPLMYFSTWQDPVRMRALDEFRTKQDAAETQLRNEFRARDEYPTRQDYRERLKSLGLLRPPKHLLADPAIVERGADDLPQLLIQGVAPVTAREQLAAKAKKPLKGGDKPPPAGGLFDDGARAQLDLSDMLRADVARRVGAGDQKMVGDDGVATTPKELIQGLQARRTALDALEACAKGDDVPASPKNGDGE